MDKVRIAIVGCGNISQLNVPGYLQHPKCEVVALCDNVADRAEARAKQWGISPRIYTDYEQVLNDPNVDAVELLTPQRYHMTMTVDGLDAGKHVSCQKPMCTSVAEADVMLAAARGGGVSALSRSLTRQDAMPIAIKLESSDEIAQVGYQAVSSAHSYVILAI